MMNAVDLSKQLITAIQSGPFPGSAAMISNTIRSYVMANGTPNPPTISIILGPCTGAGWSNLIPLASSTGVAKYIISTAVAAEFAASTKEIPGPTGIEVVPMSFNTGAMVSDLSNVTDFNQVWLEISKAVIDFFKPEVQ